MFDYKNKLYLPLRASSLNKEHEIILPHEDNKEVRTKDLIEKSDVIIAEVSYASTGQGIELGWASASQKPILCFYEQGKEAPTSLRYITHEADVVEYTGPKDLINKIEARISNVK
jgi:nucleoside 2-deoxyribosyltransferase